MQKEWKTTDKNTGIDECEDCFLTRPVKQMVEPYFKSDRFKEDSADDLYEYDVEDFTKCYCFSCYQNALQEEEKWTY